MPLWLGVLCLVVAIVLYLIAAFLLFSGIN